MPKGNLPSHHSQDNLSKGEGTKYLSYATHKDVAPLGRERELVISVWENTEKDEDAELILDHSSFHLLTFNVSRLTSNL